MIKVQFIKFKKLSLLEVTNTRVSGRKIASNYLNKRDTEDREEKDNAEFRLKDGKVKSIIIQYVMHKHLDVIKATSIASSTTYVFRSSVQ